MTKFTNKLQRLHQSRVRAIEHAEGRPVGVFGADTHETPPVRSNVSRWQDEGAVEGRHFVVSFTQNLGRFPGHALREDLRLEWTPQLSALPAIPASRVAYFDIETTGLEHDAFAFCLGVGCWRPNGFEVTQWISEDGASERESLLSLVEYLREFEALVTFNGQSFDVPRIKARLVAHDLVNCFDRLVHVDLLPIARRLLPPGAMNLATLERSLLRHQRVDDMPGSEAPRRWKQYEVTRAPSVLMPLFHHNAIDIYALTGIQKALREILVPAPPAEPVDATPTAVDGPSSELQQRLSRTYRLKQGRSVRRATTNPSSPTPLEPAPPTPSPTPAPVSESVARRIERLRHEAMQLGRLGRTLDALPLFFEMIALNPYNPYPLAELMRHYESTGEDDLARNFRDRLRALGLAL